MSHIIGSTINNYQFVSEIGSGAYGVVYKAQNIVTGEKVAIKCVSKVVNPTGTNPKQSDLLKRQLGLFFKFNNHKLQNLKYLDLELLRDFGSQNSCTFIKEISLHLKVHDHPNIVTIHEVLDSLSCVFIVMDLFNEGDLFYNIVDLKKYENNSTLVKDLFLQLMSAIEYCHSKNIFHCDIKPENILCDSNSTKLIISDFGLAIQTPLISSKNCIGSLYYMPPERLTSLNRDKTDLSENILFPASAGDIWSLAIILINLTCTRNPWLKASERFDNTFKQFIKDPKILKKILPISDELFKILVKCLNLDPYKRISLSELKKLIKHCHFFTKTDEMEFYQHNYLTSGCNSASSSSLDDFNEINEEDLVINQWTLNNKKQKSWAESQVDDSSFNINNFINESQMFV